MFTNYYKTLNIDIFSSNEEIVVALKKARETRNDCVYEEIEMVLLNKSLRKLYDEELNNYEQSDLKQSYIIQNVTLEREIKKIKAFVSHRRKANDSYRNHGVLLFLVLVLFILISGYSNYKKGYNLEMNKIAYINGELDPIKTASTDTEQELSLRENDYAQYEYELENALNVTKGKLPITVDMYTQYTNLEITPSAIIHYFETQLDLTFSDTEQVKLSILNNLRNNKEELSREIELSILTGRCWRYFYSDLNGKTLDVYIDVDDLKDLLEPV